jgi:D-alanyl-D-alanine carboxypeptidase
VNCSKYLRAPVLGLALGSAVCASMAATPARAESSILIDAASGRVLRAENATYPWYPASTTKLMTLYMTLAAIRDQRITPDTLFAVSPTAAAQAPTKMGFPVGTQVTVDNAIKMMMVKSANDMAVVLAEGLGGSVDQFAQQMTETAHRLGMTESNFVNPNGLPDYSQIMSARDLAILARALIHEFPQDSDYWHIPAIKYGRRIVRNYNPLLGRYPGTDGMKTGFVCMSGFNLVATATRDNKQLIVVVLGAPSSSARSVKAAELLEAGFMQGPLAWLMPSLGKVDALTSIDASPPDLTDEVCGRHRKHHATDEEDADAGSDSDATQSDPQFSALLSALRAPTAKTLLSDAGPVIPVVVYTGPTRSADQLAKLAAEPAVEHVKKKKHKTAVAHATDDKKTVAKPKDGKPAAEKGGHKKIDGKVTNSKAAAGKTAAAAPWTPMSSSALAASPPPELKAHTQAAAPKPKPTAADFAQ